MGWKINGEYGHLVAMLLFVCTWLHRLSVYVPLNILYTLLHSSLEHYWRW